MININYIETRKDIAKEVFNNDYPNNKLLTVNPVTTTTKGATKCTFNLNKAAFDDMFDEHKNIENTKVALVRMYKEHNIIFGLTTLDKISKTVKDGTYNTSKVTTTGKITSTKMREILEDEFGKQIDDVMFELHQVEEGIYTLNKFTVEDSTPQVDSESLEDVIKETSPQVEVVDHTGQPV
jgi:hypothetical protein